MHGLGVAFTNLAGVAVLNGISGDCNQTSLIAANFNAAGTLTIHGLKAEAESSICNPQVQDPVILATTTRAPYWRPSKSTVVMPSVPRSMTS